MLLTSKCAEAIHAAIAAEPIVDFHSHLPPGQILADQRFDNLAELWLAHDHYKWRLMRACGVDEGLITGNAEPFARFAAFAEVLPKALGSPVEQWARMELSSVFGIEERLGPDSAESIWEQTNAQLRSRWSTRALLEHFRVETVCTTDDPADGLEEHEELARLSDAGELDTRVLPTFRPDRLCYPHQPEGFAAALASLEQRIGRGIASFAALLRALEERHDAFHQQGCRLSDHGLDSCPTARASEAELDAILIQVRRGEEASEIQREAFAGAILDAVAGWNCERGWAMQLHLGPWRNVNSRLFGHIGADAGLDTIGPWPQTADLVQFLDRQARAGRLPRTIVYPLDGTQGEAVCAALQSFQEGGVAGKLQYGPAWWHNDHVPGIRRQLQTLASLSALGTGLGMLTDSRSFTSFVRHDFFRRILASFLAEQAASGEMPDDEILLVEIARKLSGGNARRSLGLG